MKIKNLLIIGLFISNLGLVKPYIVNISTLKASNNAQCIVQAGDAHFDCDCDESDYKHPKLNNKKIYQFNKKHSDALMDLAKKCPKKDCLFIVEDLDEYKGPNKKNTKNM